MTTTNTVKKPRRARRRKPKTMTEQSYPVKDVAPVKPTPKLISRGEYITDFHNRMAIHNYEIKEVIKDVRNCVSFTADTYKDFRKHFDSLQIGNDLSNT